MVNESLPRSMGQIYIVDDDPAVGKAISAMLASVGFSTETFATAEEFLSLPEITEPAVVLVDMLLPGVTGLGLCRELLSRRYPCTFAIISGHVDVSTAVEVMRLGAIDLLQKPFGIPRLLEVVSHALQTARIEHQNRQAMNEASRRIDDLSPREREILEAISHGKLSKEIARLLGISHRTVDVHRSRMMQKLGIESPLQLANLLAVLERATTAKLPAPHFQFRKLNRTYSPLSDASM